MCKIQKYIYDVSIIDNRLGLPKVFTHTKHGLILSKYFGVQACYSSDILYK